MDLSKKCAILTIKDTSGYFVYDPMVYPHLQALGWQVEEIPWDREGVDWGAYTAVIIRSTWDYQRRIDEFLEKLEQIDSSGTQLYNPLEFCRWNINKQYLRDLERKGIPTLPTQWLERLDQSQCDQYFAANPGQPAIAKPLVGANADHIFILQPDQPQSWEPAIEYYQDKPLMLQPFVPSIQTEGEFSLFYFGGDYSHTVQKQPKPGDFRVQEEHGGIIQLVTPTPAMLQLGQQVLDQLGETMLYARVDLVIYQDQLKLIELELIEPSLYFQYDPASAERFAVALDQMSRPPAMPDRRRL